jgi:hypothetical protein
VKEQIRTVPRTALRGYLRAIRLPLSAAERITKQQGNETWTPAIAFESFEAKVETATGFLLGDEKLAESGQLRTARVAELKESRRLRSAAGYERERAREEQRTRKDEVARGRARTEQAATERKQAIKQQAAQQKRAAGEQAAKREAAVRAQEAAQQKVAERRERATRSEALRAESEALDLTDKALEAQETADVIDETLEGAKEARKTG